MDPDRTIDAMRTAARALTSGDARERARAIQTAQDALDAAKADALAEIDATEAYEIDGASTLNTWVRNARFGGPQARPRLDEFVSCHETRSKACGGPEESSIPAG